MSKSCLQVDIYYPRRHSIPPATEVFFEVTLTSLFQRWHLKPITNFNKYLLTSINNVLLLRVLLPASEQARLRESLKKRRCQHELLNVRRGGGVQIQGVHAASVAVSSSPKFSRGNRAANGNGGRCVRIRLYTSAAKHLKKDILWMSVQRCCCFIGPLSPTLPHLTSQWAAALFTHHEAAHLAGDPHLPCAAESVNGCFVTVRG